MTIKTTLVTALGLTMATATYAGAVSYGLNVSVINGPQLGFTTSGTVSWDEIYVSPILVSFLTPSEGVTISLPWVGTTLTEVHDIEAPDYPELVFVDGFLDFIDFVVDDGVNGAVLPAGTVSMELNDDLSFDSLTGTFNVTASTFGPGVVPLPAGLPLLLGGLGAMAVLRRRRRG